MLAGCTHLLVTAVPSTLRINTPSAWSKPQHDAVHRQGRTPPRSTVWEYLDLWDWDGTLGRIHHALYVEVREQAGREASPTTAIIDSQTAKGAVKGGLRSTRPAMTLARRCLAASATS